MFVLLFLFQIHQLFHLFSANSCMKSIVLFSPIFRNKNKIFTKLLLFKIALPFFVFINFCSFHIVAIAVCIIIIDLIWLSVVFGFCTVSDVFLFFLVALLCSFRYHNKQTNNDSNDKNNSIVVVVCLTVKTMQKHSFADSSLAVWLCVEQLFQSLWMLHCNWTVLENVRWLLVSEKRLFIVWKYLNIKRANLVK